MRLVVDVKLSDEWVSLRRHGHDAASWREVGRRDAPDSEIMTWAVEHGRIIFTADLDFGEAVTVSRAQEPSIVQIRAGSTNPETVGAFVMDQISAAAASLADGAILTIEPGRSRTRRLTKL